MLYCWFNISVFTSCGALQNLTAFEQSFRICGYAINNLTSCIWRHFFHLHEFSCFCYCNLALNLSRKYFSYYTLKYLLPECNLKKGNILNSSSCTFGNVPPTLVVNNWIGDYAVCIIKPCHEF